MAARSGERVPLAREVLEGVRSLGLSWRGRLVGLALVTAGVEIGWFLAPWLGR